MDTETAEHRLRTDFPFFAEKCLRIVDRSGHLVPFKLNGPQLEVDRILEAQAAEGRPLRAVVLKARRLGISTYVAGKITHRYTQRANHKAVVVAHDKKTAGELFDISENMFTQLPDRTVGDLRLKPAVMGSRRREEIRLGEESRRARLEGARGLGSSLVVDTAGEIQAGRGFAYISEHLSEVGFWPDVQKMTALINAVEELPETMIVVESTANGFNHYRRFWKMAEAGESAYAPIFFPWHIDPRYSRPFINDDEREAFEAKVGEGEYGEPEPMLLEAGLNLEQLHWRRWAIINLAQGDERIFQQEFPATSDEAFLATGRSVFSVALVSKVLMRAEQRTPDQGILTVTETTEREVRRRTVDVPVKSAWSARETLDISPVGQAWWHRWAEPEHGNHPDFPPFDPQEPTEAPGQYIVTVDPSSGEENETGDLAYMAIEVIDHKTLEQVAEYRSRQDADVIAMEALKAALYYNRAMLGVEKTGGFGTSIISALWRTYHYPRLYQRTGPDVRSEKREKRLGWDTSPKTKPRMLDRGKELLRTGTDGIRSPILAGELMTYVRDELGRTGPDADAFADLLMAWLQGQMIAQELPLRTFERARTRPVRRVLSRAANY